MKKRAINFRALFYPFLAYMLGIIVAKRFYGGDIAIIITSLLSIAIFCGYLIYHKMFKALVCILAFFFIGNGFYYIGENSFNVKTYSGKVAVIGRISDDIEFNSYSAVVVLDNISINGEDNNNLRLTIENCTEGMFDVGDKVVFEAEVIKSQPFILNQFNSKDYRAGVRYSATVEFDKIVIKNGWINLDEIVRQNIKSQIYNNMTEENAGIAYAVMFGDKSDLDYEIYSSYQQSGIIHVLTVSGLHVSFLVSLFYSLLRKCGVNNIANLIISSVVIIFYAFLCGFSPSVVRAGIMAICMMTARAVRRKYDSLNALGLAGFIICIINPLTALDIGFLMSFFCVFAIIMLSPSITKFFSIFLPNKIASLISLSISAQLGILPFIASMHGTINLISFAVNLLIVPLFSVLYPFMFLVCMIGTFAPFISVLLKGVGLSLSFVNSVATFFGNVGGNIQLSPFSFTMTVMFFIILFLAGRFFMLKSVKKLSALASSFLVFVFVMCFYLLPINTTNFTSLSYINSYGTTSIVLTTQKGDSAVIGKSSLLNRFQSNYQNQGFDMFLSYSAVSDEEMESLSNLGVKKYVSCLSTADEGNCEIAELDVEYSYSNIKFKYLAFVEEGKSDKILGILVILDNQKILVANQNNLSYNYYSKVIEMYKPSIVVADKNNQLAVDNSYTCITYDKIDGCEYSYQTDGNFQLAFNGQSWIKRGLD